MLSTAKNVFLDPLENRSPVGALELTGSCRSNALLNLSHPCSLERKLQRGCEQISTGTGHDIRIVHLAVPAGHARVLAPHTDHPPYSSGVLDMLRGDIDAIVRVALQLVGIFAPIFAVVTYRRNVRIRRAEWLSTLHAKFYEADTYKHIRHLIDYEPPEFATLQEAVESGGSETLVESFVDYLNFFEFIASLWKLRQLSLEEIEMLLGYYLVNLSKHSFITAFIASQSFEHLADLLKALQKRRQVHS